MYHGMEGTRQAVAVHPPCCVMLAALTLVRLHSRRDKEDEYVPGHVADY